MYYYKYINKFYIKLISILIHVILIHFIFYPNMIIFHINWKIILLIYIK